MRDQQWLEDFFTRVWLDHFSDVEVGNQIRVVFGRRARTRLGSISVDKNDPGISIIRLNGLFKDPEIPELVVKGTLVHELCHYAHGFHSGLEQRFAHPHKGGVMRAEFAERGLERLYLQQKRWLKENWPDIVRENFKPVQRRPSNWRRQNKVFKYRWVAKDHR